MSLLNIISVPTANGIKTIEIHNADITKFPFNVDILVVSAYHYNYFPDPNTVIKALLDNYNLNFEELAKTPLIDMREPLSCWLSSQTGY